MIVTDTFTGETYNALCADAEGYLAGGTPEQARELLLKAISLIGTRPRARSLLSDTCMSMELWPEAREQLEILITLEEGNTRNNFRLGQVLEELGEYQLAADNYTVVLNENPRHHGAIVAIKRIAVRTSESGVNLVDIFATAGGGAEERGAGQAAATLENAGDRIEGMQLFPDLPSDEVFAEADGADASLSLDRMLENMGVRSASDGWKAEDVSKLLDDIKESDADNLQSMFAGQPSLSGDEPSENAAHGHFSAKSPDLESIFAGTAPVLSKAPEGVKAAPSLEEIFGTSMRAAASRVIEPEPIAVEIPEPEVIEPETIEPEVVEVEPAATGVLEPGGIAPEVLEPEAIEPEIPEPEVIEPEVLEPEVIEPETIEPEVVEVEPPAPEVLEPEVIEPELLEPEVAEVEPAVTEVLVPEVLEPEIIVPEVIAPEVLAPESIAPEVLEPEATEPGIPEPEAIEEEEADSAATAEPFAGLEADEAEPDGTGAILFATGPDPAVFSSMDALEAIFSAAAASTVIADLREQREPLPPVVAPEEPEPVAEPEVAQIQKTVIVPDEEPLGLEVVFGTEAETKGTDAAGEVLEQMPASAVSPDALPVADAPADFYVESWSPETGLVSVTLFSGALSVRTSLLAAFESSLVCEPGSDGICAVRGEGTLMLNCGPVEPLMLQAEEGLTVRTSLLALISPVGGAVQSLPVSGLSRLLSADGMKLLFQTGSPVRKVLLEGGTSALLVRSGSLAAASPGVEISEDSVLTGYLTATGQGRLYLIE
jgi:hypothetical protein